MYTFNKTKICLICLFTILTNGHAYTQTRTKADFDNGWKFKLDSINNYAEVNVNDNNWRTLNLPHDWSIEGTFDKDNPAGVGGGALPGGIGWYEKHLPFLQMKKENHFYWL